MGQAFMLVLKGFGVGASMLIPGISGGTTAIILGVYDQLIHAISDFWRNTKPHMLFLALFTLGGLAGMLMAARPLLLIFTAYPLPALFFFMGAAAGSIPLLLAKARLSRGRWWQLAYPLAGILLLLLMEGFHQYTPAMGGGTPGFLGLLLAGLISSAAFVLPGISLSYVLLLMGLYDSTMLAISQLQILYLFPLALGLLAGTFLCARLLEQAMLRYPTAAYLTICGFLLGSLLQIFPGWPSGIEWPICLLTAALGLLLVLKLSAKEKRAL